MKLVPLLRHGQLDFLGWYDLALFCPLFNSSFCPIAGGEGEAPMADEQ